LLVKLDALHKGVVSQDLLELLEATANSDKELVAFQADVLDLSSQQVLALLQLVEWDEAAEESFDFGG